MNISVLIPTYKPDQKLLTLVKSLLPHGFESILIVNDGNGSDVSPIFSELRSLDRVLVLDHAVNLGKGRALKTGLNEYCTRHPNSKGVVTADADGQHSVEDIVKIAQELERSDSAIVIGSREFGRGVPFRSKFGNILTRYVFRFLVGKKISDTQSGLRGFPYKFAIGAIALSGERYEYEINVLISTKQKNIPIKEIPIQTIYLDGNQSSHFNPIADSMRIYFLILRFAFSSIFASLVDFVVFSIVLYFSKEVSYSIIASRLVSGTINFAFNKKLVFGSNESIAASAIKYWLTVLVFGFIAYQSIQSLVQYFGMNALLAKVLIESVLFIASFAIQRDFIFTKSKKGEPEN